MMSPALPLFLPLVAGDHGDILRANPVRRAALQPAQGHFGIHQRRAVIALQAVSLGRGERGPRPVALAVIDEAKLRSEEHTPDLKSLKRTSYAFFCSKKNRRDQ